MQRQNDPNNNNNVSTESGASEYCPTWQPYLPKINGLSNQLGIDLSGLTSPKRISRVNKIPLYQLIDYSSLDLSIPRYVTFLLQDKTNKELQRRLLQTINEYKQPKFLISAYQTFNCMYLVFPTFSQDKIEDEEIKKYLFYHLMAGANDHIFQLMDEQYYNAPPGMPRFAHSHDITSHLASIQLDRDFDAVEAPLTFTCVKTNVTSSKEFEWLLITLRNVKDLIAGIDQNALEIKVRSMEASKIIICIPALPLMKQKQLFYELIGANEANNIEKINKLFISDETISVGHVNNVNAETSTPTANVFSLNYATLFKQYSIGQNVESAASYTQYLGKRKRDNQDIDIDEIDAFIANDCEIYQNNTSKKP